MKRCPECRRDYYDDTLLYCLEDGTVLSREREDDPTLYFRTPEPSPPLPGNSGSTNEASIAVLPFSNVTADRENEFFCDGLAEELLSTLARLAGLKVASRTSAFSFKGKDATISEIAEALGVTFILEGSVRRSADRLRINVQLINAANDRPVWSERYDREMKDIFDVQEEIALSVVAALKVKLLGGQRAALLKRYTDNPEAYELFLKGRFHWYKHTPADVRKSVEYFRKAIEIDPDYAPGHAGLAEFYGISSALSLMDPSVGWPLAEAALRTAQQLDDVLPEIHNGLAAVHGIYYRDPDAAESELRRAMELNSRFAEAHSLYSFILTGQGRIDEAIDEALAALNLDPLSTSYQRYLGWWLYFARRFDEAIDRYRQVLEVDPSSARLYLDLRDTFEQAGRKDHAVANWKKAAALGADTEMIAALESVADAAGAIAEGAKLDLERLDRKLSAGEWVAPIEFARCHLRLDDLEAALPWLTKAADVRDCFSQLMTVDPFFDRLRDEPRFEALVRRVRLPG